MPSTFLSLVNLTRQECGIVAADLTTLVGVSGESLRIKQWVSRTWMDVQRKHPEWEFLQSSFTFPTVASQAAYTTAQANAANFGKWKTNTFRCYVTGTGYTTELWLSEWDWESFRNLYQFGAQRTVLGRPVVFAIQPDKSIALGPLPNATSYTVIGDYYKRAMPLVNDTDVPTLPDQFVDIIMHGAKVYYGQYEAATETYESGKADYARMITELEIDQLPPVEVGGPLL